MLYCTPSHSARLNVAATDLITYLQNQHHSPVVKCVLMYVFNSAWVPIVVGMKGVLMPDIQLDNTYLVDNSGHQGWKGGNNDTRGQHSAERIRLSRTNTHKQRRSALKPEKKVGTRVFPTAQYAPGSANNKDHISAYPNSTTDYGSSKAPSTEISARERPLDGLLSAGGTRGPTPHAGSSTGLLRFPGGNLTSVDPGLSSDAPSAVADPTHRLITESSKGHMRVYRDGVNGNDLMKEHMWDWMKDAEKKRRPISAPHVTSRRSGKNDVRWRGEGRKENVKQETQDSFESHSNLGVGVRPGGHGIKQGGRRASGLEKKLTAAGSICYGDFCEFISMQSS